MYELFWGLLGAIGGLCARYVVSVLLRNRNWNRKKPVPINVIGNLVFPEPGDDGWHMESGYLVHKDAQLQILGLGDLIRVHGIIQSDEKSSHYAKAVTKKFLEKKNNDFFLHPYGVQGDTHPTGPQGPHGFEPIRIGPGETVRIKGRTKF